jgi:hypothetical protein
VITYYYKTRNIFTCGCKWHCADSENGFDAEEKSLNRRELKKQEDCEICTVRSVIFSVVIKCRFSLNIAGLIPAVYLLQNLSLIFGRAP